MLFRSLSSRIFFHMTAMCGTTGARSALNWDARNGTTYEVRLGVREGEGDAAEIAMAGKSCTLRFGVRSH